MTLSAVASWRTKKFTQMVAIGVAVGFAATLGGCGAPQNTIETQQTPEMQGSAGDATVSSQPDAALNALLKWAESGDVGAQYDLGLTLADSDPAAAGRWFEGAAMQGYGPAAYQMGLMQSDPKRAVEWYSMASVMGHVGSQHELGEAYLNGRGTAKEPEWGLMWLERAARAGSSQAQRALGQALASGAAGVVHRREALMWLLIAQVDEGEQVFSALKKSLSPAAIAWAEQQATAWTKIDSSMDVGDRATVRFTQNALNRLGFDAGVADGIDGERTYDAIVAFRAAEKMGAGGIDGALVDRLRERLSVLKR